VADEKQRWRRHAACRGLDQNLFYPERGEDVRVARAVCATCPVIGECLEHALTWPETLGIWGGTTVRERRVMRRGRGLTIRSPRVAVPVLALSVSVTFHSADPPARVAAGQP
jgi:WhiB family redox-sensing transcriptional regulator